nr:hypothetical protein CFP56_58548 [Quercus suber]
MGGGFYSGFGSGLILAVAVVVVFGRGCDFGDGFLVVDGDGVMGLVGSSWHRLCHRTGVGKVIEFRLLASTRSVGPKLGKGLGNAEAADSAAS